MEDILHWKSNSSSTELTNYPAIQSITSLITIIAENLSEVSGR